MIVYRDWLELPEKPAPSVLALGNFDGVHLGHQIVLDRAVQLAKEKQSLSSVLTFHPHPKMLFCGKHDTMLLQTLDDRIECLRESSCDMLLVAPFTREFASVTPEKFILDYLITRLGCTDLFVGRDTSFGHNKGGNLATLEKLAQQSHLQIHVVDPVMMDGQRVSSSRIRHCLAKGNVRDAARYLGRPFSLSGPVVSGAGRGHGLGFATANLAPGSTILPRFGVYAGLAEVPGHGVLQTAIHVGSSPTFDTNNLTIEAHLLDFSQNLLDIHICLYFVCWLRDIQRFENTSQLAEQIGTDVVNIRRLLRDELR